VCSHAPPWKIPLGSRVLRTTGAIDAPTYREERTMSEDERTKKRKEHEDDEAEVEAHMYDDSGDLDTEKKRQQKRHDEFGGDEPERKKK
jgi:hypothetical protein